MIDNFEVESYQTRHPEQPYGQRKVTSRVNGLFVARGELARNSRSILRSTKQRLRRERKIITDESALT